MLWVYHPVLVVKVVLKVSHDRDLMYFLSGRDPTPQQAMGSIHLPGCMAIVAVDKT